jgi:nucleotide-binding universal stress UspA family protein
VGVLPPTRILAAIDFSDASRVALTMAARFARQCRAKLHVLYAQDPLLSAAAEARTIPLAAETEREIERFVASAWPAAECAPSLHVTTGPPVAVIRSTARREAVDLIVVGSHGAAGAERLLFGSTAEGLMRRSELPVLVVPPGWTAPQPELPDLSGIGPIVTGVDFSGPSLEATEAACRLAAALHASVEAVHVVPRVSVLRQWQPHAHEAECREVESARRTLTTLIRGLASPVPVHVRIELGDIADSLVSAATVAGDGQSLLILGRRVGGHESSAPCAIAARVLTPARVPLLLYVTPQ